MNSVAASRGNRWLHACAVALACATFPLIWVGGLVTTYDAGMAVPDWPTTYGYNLFLYPLSTWVSGPWDLFIEHGHRLLGALAGLLTIVVCVSIWLFDSRAWMRWVGAAALALVVFQGLLGGARVLFDETLLARLHGCVGPLFFALAVAICIWTSPFWRDVTSVPGRGRAQVVVLSWFTAALAYLQLVLGAHLRHIDVSLSPSQFRIWVFMHLLVAAVMTVEVLVLSFLVWRRYGSRDVRGLGVGIALLVTLQLALGIGAWTVKYGWPQWLPGSGTWLRYTVQAESMLQAVTVTAHVAAGSLIWVLCVMLALRLTRRTKLPSNIPEEGETSRSDVQLEVVA